MRDKIRRIIINEGSLKEKQADNNKKIVNKDTSEHCRDYSIDYDRGRPKHSQNSPGREGQLDSY